MAKTNKSAESTTSAPVAKSADVQSPATAAVRGTLTPGPSLNPEVQQDAAQFLDRAAALWFGEPQAETDTPAEPEQVAPESKPKATQQKRQQPTSEADKPAGEVQDDDEPAAPEAKPQGEGSVLPDDDEEQSSADPEKTEGEDSAPADVQKALFKLRETRRQLREELTKKEDEIKQLREKQEAAISSVPGVVAGMPQAFAHITDLKTLAATEEWINERMDMIEDNPEGFFEKDGQGQEVERDAEWIKRHKAELRSWRRELPKAQAALEKHTQRKEQAMQVAAKRYPFVTNATHARHSIVQEVKADYPWLADDPLALGRLATALMVERGQYRLSLPSAAAPVVKPDTAPAAGAPAPKPAPAAADHRQPKKPVIEGPLSSNDPRTLEMVAALLA